MGWNDRLEDDSELCNLPEEAFGPFEGPFDPDDFWLKRADREDQLTAMREWFYARYCDPANETPYNGREGGYIFVNGGPFDPAEVLPERFSGIVDDDLIEEVIDEMHAEVGDQWAPIHYREPDDYEYDERFNLQLRTRDEPLSNLMERLRQAQSVLALEGEWRARMLAQNLAYGALIAALEAFLWETVDYWVTHDDTALRDIITKIPVLRDQQFKLGDIYEQYGGLRELVRGYLQNLVWHRWDKVAPLFKLGLGVKPPSFKPFDDALVKRHDIVHRSGHDKTGKPVFVSPHEIDTLCQAIAKFASEIDGQLAIRSTATKEDEQDDF